MLVAAKNYFKMVEIYGFLCVLLCTVVLLVQVEYEYDELFNVCCHSLQAVAGGTLQVIRCASNKIKLIFKWWLKLKLNIQRLSKKAFRECKRLPRL